MYSHQHCGLVLQSSDSLELGKETDHGRAQIRKSQWQAWLRASSFFFASRFAGYAIPPKAGNAVLLGGALPGRRSANPNIAFYLGRADENPLRARSVRPALIRQSQRIRTESK